MAPAGKPFGHARQVGFGALLPVIRQISVCCPVQRLTLKSLASTTLPPNAVNPNSMLVQPGIVTEAPLSKVLTTLYRTSMGLRDAVVGRYSTQASVKA